MRKVKLQMHMSLDGYVAGPNGEMDWVEWNTNKDSRDYVNELIDTSDTIILGRKMMPGFMTYWEATASNPNDTKGPPLVTNAFAMKMVNTPKVVFTKTLEKSEWRNTTLAKGDITKEINDLKNKSGKDIIVYGGAGLVASLISKNLIDELNLFINPAAIGTGLKIFTGRTDLKLLDTITYNFGTVLHRYTPKK
jgi:dihydrofolate reductase